MEPNKRTRITAGAKQRPRRQKAGSYFWDDAAEAIFFDTLAATCNVTASAQAAGFTTPTVYEHRRKRPGFADRWQAALEQGYARLEMTLLQAANDSLAGVPFDADRPIPRMTVDQALDVLRAHHQRVTGGPHRGPGRYARPRPLDEVRAGIERKIRAIRAARGAGDGAADA